MVVVEADVVVTGAAVVVVVVLTTSPVVVEVVTALVGLVLPVSPSASSSVSSSSSVDWGWYWDEGAIGGRSNGHDSKPCVASTMNFRHISAGKEPPVT